MAVFFEIMTPEGKDMTPRQTLQESETVIRPDFFSLVEARWDRGMYACVGLDTVYDLIPDSVKVSLDDPNARALRMFEFNRQIVDAVAEHAAAIKPNAAFFEAEGRQGDKALEDTIKYILETYPDLPVIYDAKRADIGNTNTGYVRSGFDRLRADSITLNPYLGREAIQPFLDRKEKGNFILTRTSNEGAGEFQDMMVEGKPIYLHVGMHAANEWNGNGNIGLVVGATNPAELANVRQELPRIPLLIPGVGAQGGSLEDVVPAARGRFLINSSRGIIYASNGPDFAEAAGREAQKLSNDIQSVLKAA